MIPLQFSCLNSIRLHLLTNGSLVDKDGNEIRFDPTNEHYDWGAYANKKYLMVDRAVLWYQAKRGI